MSRSMLTFCKKKLRVQVSRSLNGWRLKKERARSEIAGAGAACRARFRFRTHEAPVSEARFFLLNNIYIIGIYQYHS